MTQARSAKHPADREWLVEVQPWWRSFPGTLREFFQPRPALPAASRVPGPALYKVPRLGVEIAPWHKGLAAMVRELLHPEKLPPLAVTSKPVAVVDIWETKFYVEQVKRTWAVSLLVHATALLLMVIPFVRQSAKAESQTQVMQLFGADDIAPYKVTLPPSTKKSGGGGGGGERNPLPASKGRLPRFSLEAPLTPPAAVIRNPNPRLAAEPTVVVPPNIQIQSPNIAAYGDPLSGSLIPSSGPGGGGGIGTGEGGGVGSGRGPGVGPGWGGGYGGGAFRVGGNVSAPVCIYCPDPEYSEEAYKAKHQGMVVLFAVVDEQGRVRHLRVVKTLGLGLDEQAIRAVQNWRFRAAERFGKAVPVEFTLEVQFTLH